MKYFIILIASATCWFSCSKNDLITSPDAVLLTSAQQLHFDTVFTGRGSVTQFFTVVNDNNRAINISNIALAGGLGSAFSINVNGQAGSSFSNLRLQAGDSLYVFARVTIDPTNSLSPFLVKDSITIQYNGNSQKVYLQAYGQNARYINGGNISSNTVWNNILPYVVVKPLTVDKGVQLTLTEGTRVFMNANAPLIVNGTLQTLGKSFDSTRVIFRGDRLDEPFRDYPGTWPGIVFSNSSTNNILEYTQVLNAYQALVIQGGPTAVPARLTLRNCTIHNAYDVGLLAFNSSVSAENCAFTQIGNDGSPGVGGSNIIITGGGNHYFNHCTIATFAGFFQNHKQPVLFISNNANGTAQPLALAMDNSIIYGQGSLTENELVTERIGNSAFAVNMRHVLYKAKTPPTGVSFTNALANLDPLFDTINTSRLIFSFRLRNGSPCINTGMAGGPPTDLDGLPRPVGIRPDMGAYEKQQ